MLVPLLCLALVALLESSWWLACSARAARRKRLAEWHAYLDSQRRD